MYHVWCLLCRPTTIEFILEWLTLVGTFGKGMMEIVMGLIILNEMTTWIMLMTPVIINELRRETRVIAYPNWLKSWGGNNLGRDYTTGIRPRSYYRPGNARRGQQIGHKIPHMTNHHSRILLAMQAKSKDEKRERPRKASDSFDSDSTTILVDCGATMSITNDRRDFIGPTIKERTNIQGIGGYVASTEKGTVRWKIEDDQGRTHEIQTEAILNKKHPHKLWSPQHWAQHIGDKQGTTCTITGTSVTISSARLNFTKTITLEPASNVAIIRTAPGFRKYAKFAAKHDATQHMKTFPAVIPYNEGEVDVNRLPLELQSAMETDQSKELEASTGVTHRRRHQPQTSSNLEMRYPNNSTRKRNCWIRNKSFSNGI